MVGDFCSVEELHDAMMQKKLPVLKVLCPKMEIGLDAGARCQVLENGEWILST